MTPSQELFVCHSNVSNLRLWVKLVGNRWAGKMGWDPGTFSHLWIESCNGCFVTSLAHVCLRSLFPHFSLLFWRISGCVITVNFVLCVSQSHGSWTYYPLSAAFGGRLKVSKGQFLSFMNILAGWLTGHSLQLSATEYQEICSRKPWTCHYNNNS